MSDPETIQIYDARSAEYARTNEDYAVSDPRLTDFISACTPGGRVLDLGCGPGAAANLMAKAGFQTDAVDASANMIAMARHYTGVSARQATFDQIDGTEIYDGIWANFCLLHAPRVDFPNHLAAIHTALKPNGVFYIAMKLGTSEARDKLGRQYTYYTADELVTYLTTAGFTVQNQAFGQGKGLDGSTSDWISVATHV